MPAKVRRFSRKLPAKTTEREYGGSGNAKGDRTVGHSPRIPTDLISRATQSSSKAAVPGVSRPGTCKVCQSAQDSGKGLLTIIKFDAFDTRPFPGPLFA